MTKIQAGISIPEELMKKLDAQADAWLSNRSQAITRIIQEWLEQQNPQTPTKELEPTR